MIAQALAPFGLALPDSEIERDERLNGAIVRQDMSAMIWEQSHRFGAFQRELHQGRTVAVQRIGQKDTALFDALYQAGLIVSTRSGFEAADADARSWLGGRWLEELVAALLASGTAIDVTLSQRIAWPTNFAEERQRSEIDVIACYQGRLAFISCKAARTHALEHEDGEDRLMAAVHEADFWSRHFADAKAKAAVVTTADAYDEAGGQFRSAELMQRAESLGVALLPAETGSIEALRHSLLNLLQA
jgi:hypothetical protein